MGLFGSKTNSNSKSSGTDNFNNNTSFTTAPTNPQWVQDAGKGIYAGAAQLAGFNPTSYVAGPTANLVDASTLAGQLGPQSQNYAEASGITRGVADAGTPSIAGNIDQFMDPYLKDVVDATGADLDHSDMIARQQADLSDPGAFGSSGMALTRSAMEDALSRGRATTLGGLRSQGYAQALQGAQAQAGLEQGASAQRLAAGGQIANIADAYGANDRANVASKVAAGTPLQAIDQAKASAPLDLQSWLASIFAGSQPGLFQGQTGTEDQTGTEVQTGKGNTSGTTFGFGGK